MVAVGLLAWTLGFAAHADGLHSGIRADSVPVLGDPLYLAPDYGWMARVADVAGGDVRMFVAPSEEAAEGWYAKHAKDHGLTRPLALGVDAAVQGGGRVLWRDGNVAALVTRPSGGAVDLAQRLVASLEPVTPWPAAPQLKVDGLRASVDGEWAAVRFETAPVVAPGKIVPKVVRVAHDGKNGATFSESVPGVTVMAWDAFGRGNTVRWAPPED